MFDLAQFLSLDDRFPAYRALRDAAPVLPVEIGPVKAWVATRYGDVARLLKDPDARVKPVGLDGAPAGLGRGSAAAMFEAQLVLSDPPDHNRLRALALPAFTARRVEALRAWIEARVDAALDAMEAEAEVDLVEGLAASLPGATILHVLGVPDADWKPLISRVPAFLNLFSPFPIGPDAVAACDEACAFYMDYFGALVDRRLRAPGPDDMVGRLVAAHAGDARLSRNELLALLHAFLNAGFETTMSAIGAGVLSLLRQPDAWAALVADPERAGEALDETLRFEAPIHFVRRFPVADIELSGVPIRAGDAVLLALASANRDERRFEDPDRLWIGRPDNAHLTFGGGRHFCLGALLAKLEARTALEGLARRWPRLELLDPRPPRQSNLLFHAVQRLPVAPRVARLRTRAVSAVQLGVA